ncbi:DNA methylase [Lentzea sp. NPDC051838]|uniref:DNA methylase n=1 Tax=Lentzea sp. NPDC051838 TaxID=3154849 RepID=UPI0034430BDB
MRGTSTDTDLIPPAIAAHAIATYSLPGDLVLDPACGAGIVLVTALQAGRHALGLTTDSRWWTLARANITATKAAGAWHDGSILDASPKALTTIHAAGLVGRVGLVLTSLRTATGDPGEHTTGLDRDPTATIDELAATLACCEPLLRAGGHLVVVARPRRNTDGSLADLTTPLIAAGISAGLAPVDRCVALSAELRGERLVSRASFADRRAVARARVTTGTPIALTAHHEVLVFRLAHDAELAAAGADSSLPFDHKTATRPVVNGVDYPDWRRAA